MQPSKSAAPLTNPQTALNIHLWLNQIQAGLEADYSENKSARKRSPQSGQAWLHYRGIFGPPTRSGWTVMDLFPYANHDHLFNPVLFHSALFFAVELVSSTAPDNAAKPHPAGSPAAFDFRQLSTHPKLLLSRDFKRFCDWVDALCHLAIHGFWHAAPIAFDPDPDKRKLASLGVFQRVLPHATADLRQAWESFYSESAARFKDSPQVARRRPGHGLPGRTPLALPANRYPPHLSLAPGQTSQLDLPRPPQSRARHRHSA